ncbi:hypothetical protein BJX62DRAFT_181806 [Aspergillus germanicus]
MHISLDRVLVLFSRRQQLLTRVHKLLRICHIPPIDPLQFLLEPLANLRRVGRENLGDFLGVQDIVSEDLPVFVEGSPDAIQS